jgi:hypothetical protein
MRTFFTILTGLTFSLMVISFIAASQLRGDDAAVVTIAFCIFLSIATVSSATHLVDELRKVK